MTRRDEDPDRYDPTVEPRYPYVRRMLGLGEWGPAIVGALVLIVAGLAACAAWPREAETASEPHCRPTPILLCETVVNASAVIPACVNGGVMVCEMVIGEPLVVDPEFEGEK